MGLIVKPRRTGVYGALVRIYPQSFRNRFGTTMVQTFEDMLKSEQTKLGRLKVWARTLIDLPFSATKEYATNGKEVTMDRNIKLLLGATILAIVIVGVGSYWAGSLHSRQTIGIDRVSIAQLGDAMQQDDFYSSYGDSALLFSGTVASFKDDNTVTSVAFATNRPYNVVCQFPSHTAVKLGQTISVAAPGGSAERQKAGVLLHNCSLNT